MTTLKITQEGKILNDGNYYFNKHNGYWMFIFSDNHRKLHYVHHLVARHFLGECQNHGKGKVVIDHIDGDKTNNHPQNLRYVSHRQNLVYAKALKNGTCSKIIPAHKGWRLYNRGLAVDFIEGKKFNLKFTSRDFALAVKTLFDILDVAQNPILFIWSMAILLAFSKQYQHREIKKKQELLDNLSTVDEMLASF